MIQIRNVVFGYLRTGLIGLFKFGQPAREIDEFDGGSLFRFERFHHLLIPFGAKFVEVVEFHANRFRAIGAKGLIEFLSPYCRESFVVCSLF